ncbi:MAG TPA: hypothetical protein EYP16_07015 [Candidatus Atribacteria bacterium]|nr:hypothetical protein [Candidatus Atribacteria bacterium]
MPDDIKKIMKGVFIEGKIVKPKLVEILKKQRTNTMLRVVVGEGRKREIRRMFHYIGHDVQKLIRVRIGPVKLENLKTGKYRDLKREEVEWFFNKRRRKNR